MQLLFWFHLWAKFWMTLKCRAQTMCSFLGFHLWSSDAYGTALPMSSATTLNTGSSDSSQMSSFLLVVSFLLSPRVLVFHYFRLFFFSFPQMQHQNSFFLTSLKPTPHSSVPSAIVVVQTAFMTMNDLCVFGFCKPLDHPACCCPWLVLFYFHLMWFNSMLWAATFLPYSVLCTSSSNSKNEGDITQREQFVLSRKP